MAKKKGRDGLPSIFRNKAGGSRYQGIVTKRGTVRFEQARARLGRLAKRDVARVSDADVMEYLARGEEETIDYIREHAPK